MEWNTIFLGICTAYVFFSHTFHSTRAMVNKEWTLFATLTFLTYTFLMLTYVSHLIAALMKKTFAFNQILRNIVMANSLVVFIGYWFFLFPWKAEKSKNLYFDIDVTAYNKFTKGNAYFSKVFILYSSDIMKTFEKYNLYHRSYFES